MPNREQQIAEMLQEAEQLHLRLVASLPKYIDAKNIAVRSTAPFKALTVREALFHRTEELTESPNNFFGVLKHFLSCHRYLNAAAINF